MPRDNPLPGVAPTQRYLILGGTLLSAPIAALAFLDPLLPPATTFLTLFSIAFLIYGWIAWRSLQWNSRSVSWTVLGFGVLFRFALLIPDVALSDDVYRYLWEGRVGNFGFNPFIHAPESLEIAHLRNPQWELVTHKEVPTVYPPICQWSFQFIDSLGFESDGDRAYRLLIAIADMITLLLLSWGLRRCGKPMGRLVIYAWNPLVLVELCGSGHLDGLAIPLFTLGLIYYLLGRRWAMTLALAVGSLTKLHAMFLMPLIFKGPRPWAHALVFGSILCVGFLPFVETGFLDGLGSYARHWSFNSPSHDSLHNLAEMADSKLRLLADSAHPEIRTIAWAFDDGLATRFGLALVMLAGMGIALIGRWKPETRALIVFTSFLATTPTLHPWYLVWLLPILTMRPYAPLILLTGTTAFTYVIVSRFRGGEPWEEIAWVRWIEFGPVLLWIGVDALRLFVQRHRNKCSAAIELSEPA